MLPEQLEEIKLVVEAFHHKLYRSVPTSVGFLPTAFQKLADYISTLENAIRNHRDQRGDDRCWQDDETLYSVLPEGYTPPARDSEVELGLCQKFIDTRHNPRTTYISPQRRIEELEAEIERLSDGRWHPAYPTEQSAEDKELERMNSGECEM